jgi:sensor histidine kinase YesM
MNEMPAQLGKFTVRLLQVLLWFVFYLLLLLYTSHKWNQPFGFYNSTIAIASYLLVVYGHALWLLPAYLYKNKRPQYFVFSLIFVGAVVVLRMWAEKLLLLPIHKQFYAFQWAHASFTTITLLVAFLFGALLRVLFNYLNLLKVKNELQSRQAEAELKLLKAQVQPHFLFNTLNNIYSLAQSRSERTPEMIAKLSELMRFFIEEAPKEKINIGNEVAFMKNYIELEQIRMVHPVRINWQVEAAMLDKQLPPMLLMPFVENVFKHGVDKLKRDNEVTILLQNKAHKLIYIVTNSLCDEVDSKIGSGLSNLKKRLDLLYAGDYLLETAKQNGCYIAKLMLPY